MGDDGHTSSLFSAHRGMLFPSEPWAIPTVDPQGLARISTTSSALQAVQHPVLLLGCGKQKAWAECLAGCRDDRPEKLNAIATRWPLKFVLDGLTVFLQV
eukprot:gnl/Ergobibamus_cyprinoides/2992.p4 GENE.gnl/Ergobibamus_cyprinoides/2992~~gnl/Ergobibamus_cyprinoides/2992.p4  ORF type:complete len:100 (+),score=18.50 gnl/Ergobibamus_cyprinoides/2992:462-761(+)